MSKILEVKLVDTDDEKPLHLMFAPRLYEDDCPTLVKNIHAIEGGTEVSENAALAALETLAVYFIDKKLCKGSLDIHQHEADLIAQKETQEMSLKEIEDILGYPIKIVNKES